MKKSIILSVVAVGLLSSANAADSVEGMFSEGKVSGQIREYSISRTMDYSNPAKDDFTKSANAIGGHLKFESADFNGLSFGTAFYTTNGFANDSKKTDYTKVDPTLLGPDNDSYSILGEAYLQYKAGNTIFKAGRQKLATPLAGTDDARMLPNLFEAYLLMNKDIPNTTLIAGHVRKFAQGTFGRAYNGGILAATGGCSAVDTRNQVGSFKNMGSYAIGKKTDGVSVAAAIFTGVEGLKVQAWDYYAHDILNAIYADASYKMKLGAVTPFVAAQFIKENDIGDKLLSAIGGNGAIDSSFFGAKIGASVENFKAYLAYSATSENSATDTVYSNAIISPWGGMPAYTQGMVTRHVFLAGTKATKIATSYNFKSFGPDLKTVLYYASYDMAKHNGYTYGDASESGFDITYKPAKVKGLNLRLRGNFADDFNVATTGDTVGWSEYRFIMNYSF